MRSRISILSVVATLGMAAVSHAGWWSDREYGTTWERICRAGNPHCVAPWARCSFTRNSNGYYVGGGTPYFFGRGRCEDEGTWGWDYDPCRALVPRVALKWTRCERYQGGTGSYEPDHSKFERRP